jgi:hypothetical protein
MQPTKQSLLCWLPDLSLNHFMGLEVPLQQMLEHTIIRGKTSCAFSLLPPGQSLDGQALLQLDASGGTPAANPRIRGVQWGGAGGSVADGMHDAAMAALLIIKPTDLATVATAAQVCAGQPAGQQLAGVVQALLSAAVPVYGLHVDMCLECSSHEGLGFVAGYVSFLLSEQERERSKGPAAQALDVIVACAQSTGVITHGDQCVSELLRASSPAKQALLKYHAIVNGSAPPAAVEAADVGGVHPTMNSGATSGKRSGTAETQDALPGRFADATLWR